MSETGLIVLSITVLTAGSLFFSLNHLALRGFSQVKLQEGFKAAGREQMFGEFVNCAESLALACAFFRLAANVVIIMLLMRLFETKHYIITFFVAVMIFEIFTLAIPHSWAKHTGQYILPRTYSLLKLLALIAWPFLVLFSLHDRLVHRLAGVADTSPDQQQEQKQEHILSIVEQGRMEGVVDEEQMEMIEGVLELGDTTVEEIMTPRTDVIGVSADADLQTVLDTVSKAGHSRIPVYEDTIDNIVGMVYAKDLLAEIGKDSAEFNLRKKTRQPYFVPETKPLKALLHEFQNQKLHIAVVLDEYGGTAGVVTIEDILEELVGEITDEYEKTSPQPMKRVAPNIVEIDARMYVDELNSDFELKLPEDQDYDTVGGFVFSHLGYIPKTGESFGYNDVRFTIIAAEPRRIKKIRIEKTAVDSKDDR